jgi:hypothetical protein
MASQSELKREDDMTWAWIRNLALLAAGAATGYFYGRLLSERDSSGEQRYILETGLLLDLDDGRGFTRWTEVPSLSGAGPQDQVFVVDSEAGKIVLGDGVHGRRPPAESGIVKANYERRSLP